MGTNDILVSQIAQHPNIQEELYQQVSSSSIKEEDALYLFQDGLSQTSSNASTLLATHIWYETLRIHPVIPF
jgi:cytochrome P450